MKQGIMETTEALIAGLEIGVRATKLFKDGVQVSDFGEFYSQFIADPKFKAMVQLGWEGREQIKGEVADVDLVESVQLVTVAAGYVPKFIEALK